MSDAANSTKAVVGRPFKPGQSGNPHGKPKGMVAAATLIHQIALQIAKAKHPQADKISEAVGYPVKTRLQVILLQLAKDDPRTFLAYLGGKPRETVELFSESLPPVVNVRFANDDKPATPAPDTA
jgi:hypothetical protein